MSSSRFLRRSRLKALSSALLGILAISLTTSRTRAGSIFDDDIVTPPQPAPTVKPEVAPLPKPRVDPAPSVVKPPVRPGPATQPAPLVVTPSPVVPVPVGSSPKVVITLKRKIPEKADRDHLHKLFNEAYADQMKDLSIPARRKLAQSLLDEAAKNTSAETDYFVLLGGAIKSAEEGSSLRLTFTAIDQLAAAYEVDGSGLKVGAVLKLWAPTPTAASVSVSNVQNSFDLIDELLLEDDLTNALAVATALERAAHSLTDTELRTAALRRTTEVAGIANSRDRLNPSLEKLKTAPDDPAANGAVGEFLCLMRGKWDNGLPYLAKGSNPVLKDLAAAELRRPADQETVGKIADGWWDAAVSLPAADRAGVLQHAATIYRVALTSFSGVRRLAMEKRVAEAPVTTSAIRRIDLLDNFDPAVGVLSGDWRLENGTLICSRRGPEFHVEFPGTVPAEYDLRVSFVPTGGNDAVCLICSHAGHQFSWTNGGWARTVTGIDLVNGKRVEDNPTTKRRKQWLVNGHRYTCVVRVRKDGVQGYLNGELISAWKTDYSDLNLVGGFNLKHDDTVGIGVHESTATIDFAELIDVSRQGQSGYPSVPPE